MASGGNNTAMQTPTQAAATWGTPTDSTSTSNQFVDMVMQAARAKLSLTVPQFISIIEQHGLMRDDERLVPVMEKLSDFEKLTEDDVRALRNSSELLDRALNKKLIIPDFVSFQEHIREIYDTVLPDKRGKNADYIPQLREDVVDPEQFGIAVTTIDGQRWCIGDVDIPFCVQSCSKVITYAIAQSIHGPDEGDVTGTKFLTSLRAMCDAAPVRGLHVWLPCLVLSCVVLCCCGLHFPLLFYFYFYFYFLFFLFSYASLRPQFSLCLLRVDHSKFHFHLP